MPLLSDNFVQTEVVLENKTIVKTKLPDSSFFENQLGKNAKKKKSHLNLNISNLACTQRAVSSHVKHTRCTAIKIASTNTD